MNITDCAECLDGPCICGEEYRGWGASRRMQLVTAIIKGDHKDIREIPEIERNLLCLLDIALHRRLKG